MGDPQPDWYRWQFTSWVYAGAVKGEHRERLAQVPEEIRQYVRERVEYLFNLGNKNRRM